MEREPPRTHALDRFPAAAVRFVRALEQNRESIAVRHGLSPSELRALFWIGEQGSVRPKELAAHMEMTTGVTAISHRIVELGLLERIAHPEDRRSLFLELTPAGHAMMTEMHTDFTSMVAGSALMLSVEELAAFESALTVVATEVFSRLGR